MGQPFKPGVVLRQLRLIKGVGLRELARNICCDPGHLSRMESGDRPLTVAFAQLADSFLATGGVLSALVCASYAGARCFGGQTEAPPGLLIVKVATPQGEITVSIPRRDVLMALGIGAIGNPVLRGLNRVAVPPDTVEGLHKTLDSFVIAGRVMPPGSLVDPLTGRVAVISAIRRKADARLDGQLAVMQARFAEFLSWMHEENGDLAQAIWWIDRADEWAQAAGWAPMVAFASVRKSVIATMHAGDARRTLDLAQAALHTDGATPGVLRFAAAQVAYGHALTGDLETARPALDLAASYYEKAAAHPEDEPSIGARSVLEKDPVELNLATCNVFAGRGDPAIDVFAPRMEAVKGVSPRAWAVHGARLAHAYALAGYPDETCHTIAEVLDTTESIESATARSQLRRIRPVLLRRWPNRTDARDTAQRLATLT
ncbi:MAG: helix-turn-helix domain-containing protein [Egibacteraceae bacterium]